MLASEHTCRRGPHLWGSTARGTVSAGSWASSLNQRRGAEALLHADAAPSSSSSGSPDAAGAGAGPSSGGGYDGGGEPGGGDSRDNGRTRRSRHKSSRRQKKQGAMLGVLKLDWHERLTRVTCMRHAYRCPSHACIFLQLYMSNYRWLMRQGGKLGCYTHCTACRYPPDFRLC